MTSKTPWRKAETPSSREQPGGQPHGTQRDDGRWNAIPAPRPGPATPSAPDRLASTPIGHDRPQGDEGCSSGSPPMSRRAPTPRHRRAGTPTRSEPDAGCSGVQPTRRRWRRAPAESGFGLEGDLEGEQGPGRTGRRTPSQVLDGTDLLTEQGLEGRRPIEANATTVLETEPPPGSRWMVHASPRRQRAR